MDDYCFYCHSVVQSVSQSVSRLGRHQDWRRFYKSEVLESQGALVRGRRYFQGRPGGVSNPPTRVLGGFLTLNISQLNVTIE